MKKHLLQRWLAFVLAALLALPGITGNAYAAGSGAYGDVSSDSWYADAIDYVTEHGIMGGYENGSFGPEDPLSRAQLVVTLYHIAGSPQVAYRDMFPDVPADSRFAKEVTWAVDAGIIKGM